RRGQLVEAVVVADAVVGEGVALVAPALVGEALHDRPLVFRLERDSAAFAGRDLLVRIKGENGRVPERSHLAAAVGRSEGFARVLDNGEAMAVSELSEGVELDRVAEQVDGQDCLRS